MSVSALVSLALYAFVTSITPGPNNLMLATSGLTFGFRRTLPHIAGVAGGVAALTALVGLGLGAAFQAEPRLQLALKIVGAAYLLWLAWKLWRAGELDDAGGGAPLGLWAAAAFQFVNPKGLVMVVTAVSAFAPSGEGYAWRVLAVCLVFLAIGTPCMSSWVLFGATARRVLSKPAAILWFNRVMAALTAATAALIATGQGLGTGAGG